MTPTADPAATPTPEPPYLTATRTSYSAIAEPYLDYALEEFGSEPYGRAMLTAFAERIRARGGARVVEVGSGPGYVTSYLHGLGLDISGVDLAPGMVALASRSYPGLRFTEGTMTALDLPDACLGGLVAWYSLIHIPPEHRPGVLAEFHRVLAPGGYLQLAFQTGQEEPLHFAEAFGHPVSLDFHRLAPEALTEQLTRTGFTVRASLVRAPEETERTPHAYVLACKEE
ncbi:class I SAM-dependent methyltransferase [Streptomyces physcomitrii]|uniref:class I SAM-dependent methyltransferase n=1 Tax=Streptomyces physcomitrii TaxID=2724184 RepID=UPI0033F565FD